MTYFFILGNNPALSAAEIIAVLKKRGVAAEHLDFPHISSEALLWRQREGSGVKINPAELLEELGGTVKIGMIYEDFCCIIREMNPRNIKDLVFREARLGGGKFCFGFSLYFLDQKTDKNLAASLPGKIKKLGLDIKRELKEMGISSRFVVSQERFLSSVIVGKNKLLPEKFGLEMAVLVDGGKFYLGRTMAVQKFEEYGARDYGRPGRDALAGMMPPKLAKMMINFASTEKNQTVLDPFCGSGTVLQEAALLGYKNIIGSDVSEKAVKDAEKNIKWLIFNFQLSIFNWQIFQADVKNLSQKLPANSVDAIVTEPYLGPPLHGNESPERIKSIIKELSELYLAAFGEFGRVLKKGGRVCIVFPIFREFTSQNQRSSDRAIERSKLIFLPILEEVKKMGFKIENLIPEELRKDLPPQDNSRGSIVYSRPNQKVLREIFIFSF